MGRLKQEVWEVLCCPACKHRLECGAEEELICPAPECRAVFPIVNGVPILINEQESVFRIRDFVDEQQTTFTRKGRLKELVGRLLPDTGLNLKARENFKEMERLLLQDTDRPRVLIVGGGVLGKDMDAIIANDQIEFVESDVAFMPRTQLVCDGHDLPFPDGYFHGVVVQQVLEHVADPPRCVEEIYRVLQDNGLVYAETPFLQRVHMGRYDFTRFTSLGHRRLFRRFQEIRRGAHGGSGMALAGAYFGFLTSFARSRPMRNILVAFGRTTAFWLKYCDYFTIDTPAGLDSASETFFLGRKSGKVLSDRELIDQYRGASSL